MKKLLLIPAFVFISLSCKAQISQGGSPLSFSLPEIPQTFETKILQQPDMNFIGMEDTDDEKNGVLRKIARSVSADINLNNSGTWEVLSDGNRIWRLKIVCKDALALGVYYNRFWLPDGAKLFLYNENKSQVLGAYTKENNHESGLFANELIAGDVVILEYFEPARTQGASIIQISEIAYVYRDFNPRNGEKDFGESESCEVNINCSEGANWQDEKKGVARIMIKVGFSYGWCTGTLLNNEREDCTPYFLTADHCGEGASTADLNQWVFYFNYEAPGCPNPSTEPSSNTMTGCAFKSSGGNGGSTGSDFYLVQLNQTPSFNPYYNGWDRNDNPSSSSVSIHHPYGDIKKISTYTTALVSSTWQSVPNTHWRVVWAVTANGHGVTEEGSSGSPIFNSNGQVVGDLTGGGSYCNTPTQPDLYGKFSYSWDQNGTTPATRLKDWLDPDETGITTLNGFYCGGGTTLNANFSGTPTSIPVGGTVDFSDLSSGSPTSWSWTFTGGTPSSSATQNPTGIQYNTAGIYPVSLTASNATDTDTETKNNYITVGDPPPAADFVGNPTSVLVGGTVNFTDLSGGSPTSWSWTFTGGTPSSSTLQNPTGIQYNAPGSYAVSLTATNANGSDTETKTAYIYVGNEPGLIQCDSLRYPLPGNLVMYSVYYPNGTYGYVSGNNGYSDKAKADFFTPMAPFIKIEGVLFKFGRAKRLSSHHNNIAVHVWDNSGPGGSPGNILLTDSIPFAQIISDVNNHNYTFFEFSTPLDVTNSFFLGVVLPSLPGDTLALMTNKSGQSLPGTAWELWQNDLWYPYSNISSWSYDLSHAIFPVLCNPLYFNIPENKSLNINIYPNPTNEFANVSFGTNYYENIRVRVYNLVGKEVKNFVFKGSSTNVIRIDLSDCPAGVYMLNIQTDNFTTGKKITLLK